MDSTLLGGGPPLSVTIPPGAFDPASSADTPATATLVVATPQAPYTGASEYNSCVYELQYWFNGNPYTTWVRVRLPLVDATTVADLGVVLFVEGSNDSTAGVAADETSEASHETLSRLSAGKAWSVVEDLASFPCRDGEPVITVYFSQPARGPAEYPASGSLDYLGTTPLNTTGRDGWGPQTMEIMDLAMGLVEGIVADYAARVGRATPPLRLVVLSSSAGLFAAGCRAR